VGVSGADLGIRPDRALEGNLSSHTWTTLIVRLLGAGVRKVGVCWRWVSASDCSRD
jgi:hypothetical protein